MLIYWLWYVTCSCQLKYLGNTTRIQYLRSASADTEDADILVYMNPEGVVVHNPKTLLAEVEADYTFDPESIPADQQVQTYKAGQVPANRIHLHSLLRSCLLLE